MALTFGFYNSLDGDRKYDAEQMGSIFDGVIKDGVYMDIGDHFNVTPSGSGLGLIIGSGRAWFNHTWTYNDSPMDGLMVPTADPVNTRIDAVVLDVNKEDNTRANSIIIVTGVVSATNPQKPALANTEQHKQYPLAYITVTPNMTTLTQSAIENTVGTLECPFVTGVVQTMEIDTLIAQWQQQWQEDITVRIKETDSWTQSQKFQFENWRDEQENNYNAWMNKQETDYSSWIKGQEQDWSDWSEANKITFQTWFESLQTILADDVAGNLQVQIDNLTKKEFDHFHGMMNKTTKIATTDVVTITETTDEAVNTTVIFESGDTTTITATLVPNDGEYQYVKTTTITQSGDDIDISETYEQKGKE